MLRHRGRWWGSGAVSWVRRGSSRDRGLKFGDVVAVKGGVNKEGKEARSEVLGGRTRVKGGGYT